jgi:hypothetical protein
MILGNFSFLLFSEAGASHGFVGEILFTAEILLAFFLVGLTLTHKSS